MTMTRELKDQLKDRALTYAQTIIRSGQAMCPIAHFFKPDGRSEIVGLPFTLESKSAYAAWIRAKLAGGDYEAVLIISDSYIRDKTGRIKGEAIICSFESKEGTVVYEQQYYRQGDQITFGLIKSSNVKGGQFADLFNGPIAIPSMKVFTVH